jgi:DNA uptake protein ComE-like DNA-binding protein
MKFDSQRSAFTPSKFTLSNKSIGRRGMALLVVVVLVMFVSLAAYRYSFEMENEYRLTRLQEEQVQARLCAQSGFEFAANLLEQPMQIRQGILQGEDASRAFGRDVVQSNPAERNFAAEPTNSVWRFTLLSGSSVSSTQDSQSNEVSAARNWKWGWESESAKLHIPTLLRWNQMRPGLAKTVLMTLPEADEEAVDGWLASLGVRTATTAGQDALQMAMGGGMQSNLQRQQRVRSLERFKLRWFGGDLDQNYRLDPWEETLMDQLLTDPMGGQAPMSPMAKELSKVNTVAMGQASGQGLGEQSPGGWNRYLTWVQGERNERPNGKPRVWLNQPDLRRLHQELSEVMSVGDANFIIAFRQYGPAAARATSSSNVPVGSSATRPAVQRGVSGMGGSATGASGKAAAGGSGGGASMSVGQWTPNWQVPSKYLLKNPLELVEATLTIESSSSSQVSRSPEGASASSKGSARQTMSSPWGGSSSDNKTRLSKLLLETTTIEQPIIEGRVDITEASAIVLGAIPGLTPELGQRIVQARQENTAGQNTIESIGWLVEKGIVDWVKLGELEPYITTRSDVFSLQSVGFRDDRSPVFRSTVVIDARQIPAQIRDVRVWHPWDRGFSTEALTQSVP